MTEKVPGLFSAAENKPGTFSCLFLDSELKHRLLGEVPRFAFSISSACFGKKLMPISDQALNINRLAPDRHLGRPRSQSQKLAPIWFSAECNAVNQKDA